MILGHITLRQQLDVVTIYIHRAVSFAKMSRVHREGAVIPSTTTRAIIILYIRIRFKISHPSRSPGRSFGSFLIFCPPLCRFLHSTLNFCPPMCFLCRALRSKFIASRNYVENALSRNYGKKKSSQNSVETASRTLHTKI